MKRDQVISSEREKMEKKRLTAIKVRISDIVNGKFDLVSNNIYVLTKSAKKIGRARILASVVDKFVSADKKFYSITIDDGTDTIRAKVFDSLVLEKIDAGDIVDVIGRINEYNGEIYILLENVWMINDPNVEILRELEIREQNNIMNNKKRLVLDYKNQISDMQELKHIMKEFGLDPEEVESIIDSESIIEPDKEENIGTDDQKQKILTSIEQLDKGEGCTYTELMDASGLTENILDVVIEELLNEGLCFEPKPGRIRKL